MSLYCDVALPVPLDRVFTYELGSLAAVVGARVLVPFGGQMLQGVVVRVHDTAPGDGVAVKRVQAVLDDVALLSDELMELGRWIAAYYCAPLGEVLRGMMPLMAEVRRQWVYRIAEQGRKVLYEGAAKGSSRRSKLSAEDQNREYAVLNYLEPGDAMKTATLRSATGANKALLDAMAKKKWLVREPLAEVRDARRVEMLAVLEEQGSGDRDQGSGETRRLPKLNENQLAVMAELAGCGGRELVRVLRARLIARGVPESSLGTLVKRGLVRLEETAQAFHVTGLSQQGKKFAHEHALNEAQTEALATIVASMEKGGFKPHLLYGVTGSGKTAVYVAAMQRALAAGKSALLLVPEIGLTPGTAAQMVAAFGSEVALLHSQLTPDERAEQWHRIRRGEARVVIGTRSAVFAPMPELGLILVDEEHDGSYKQEETPRYHGRDVAVMRAKFLGIPVVLGSATPSLESWHNAERGRYTLVEMRERVQQRPLPAVEMIDMREEYRAGGGKGPEAMFSRRLIAETQATLDRGEQAVILINRRGYSFVVMCRSCGEKVQCENCAISLTYHKPGNEHSMSGEARAGQRLECHYCGFRRGVPKACEKCASEHLYYMGAGSQQGEEKLAEIFPNARIGRMDRDTVRGRGDMERLLARLHSGEINLLVGTQMIAKGHDIHGVTLVGVVGADLALGLPDFRAAERVFQLLTQVSGRAGRGELPGKVLVQTYQPEHYVNQFARTHDYTGFAAREMYFRKAMRYPPVSVLANVIVQSEKLEEVLDWSARIGRAVQQMKPEGVRVLGPAAAPNARLKRIYRYHLVLKADRRDLLSRALRGLLEAVDREEIPRRAVVVDVDPMHLM